jgi:hypothetical protein
MCKEWREIDSRSNGMDIYREMKEKKSKNNMGDRVWNK